MRESGRRLSSHEDEMTATSSALAASSFSFDKEKQKGSHSSAQRKVCTRCDSSTCEIEARQRGQDRKDTDMLTASSLGRSSGDTRLAALLLLSRGSGSVAFRA